MTRLLFIGNSHLVAIKTAWEAAERPYDAEFFGAPQRAWARMALLKDNHFGLTESTDYKRQRQITEQANGKAAVSLTGRDIIVIVGGFSAAEPVATLLAEADIAGLRETGAPTLLSDTFFAKALLSLAETALPEKGWHNRPEQIVLIPRPAPAETCLASSYPGYQPWHRLASNPQGAAEAFDMFDDTLTAVMDEAGLTYLPQPASTRTPIGLTLGALLAPGGGIQQGEAQKRGDHAHMNPTYGAACVESLLTWLQRQPQP